MTGFGAAEGPVGAARASVELRSVNHRFFSPAIKLPSALNRWEGDVRELLRARVARGHVSVLATLQGPRGTQAVIDEATFAARAAALRELQERHGLGGTVDVATVLRMPDVVRVPEPDDASETEGPEFAAVVTAAADALVRSRIEEGARLVAIVRERLAVLDTTLSRIAARAPARVVAHRDRLRERVVTLLEGRPVDEMRLAQEVALLAERLDVGEEIDRFRAHLASFHATLDAAPDAGVGKRLGFLLQELLREANTMGSKANDAEMQAEVVALKEELERIREQVENLE